MFQCEQNGHKWKTVQTLSPSWWGSPSRAPTVTAFHPAWWVRGARSYSYPWGRGRGWGLSGGSIVSVPLGPGLTLGVVWGPPKDMVAHNRLRDIAVAYDIPPLSEELLKLVDWVSRYTLAPPGQVLRAVLRSTEALDTPRPVIAYRRTGHAPEKPTPAPPPRPP